MTTPVKLIVKPIPIIKIGVATVALPDKYMVDVNGADFQEIEADTNILVQNSNNEAVGTIEASPKKVRIADAVAVLKDSAGVTISSTNLKAQETKNITAPDGTVNVNKSDGSLISARTVKSNGSANYNVGDATAVLKNSAGTTIKTEPIKATESEDILVPDFQINVNSVDRGDVVSNQTIDINLTDGAAAVTPTSVVKVGNTLTVEVPVGAAPAGVSFQMPKPSQWETFRDGDTGWKARNGWYDYSEPANPKVYAELDYAAGTNGLYLTKNNLVVNGVSSKRRFRDVDGGQTFSATGNKNAVVIDTLSGIMATRLNQVGAGGTWEAMVDAALAYSITVNGVVYDDWVIASCGDLEFMIGKGYLTDPNTGVDLFFQSNATQWTGDTRIASSGNAYYYDLGNFTINTLAKTTPSQRTILVRKCHNLITAP